MKKKKNTQKTENHNKKKKKKKKKKLFKCVSAHLCLYLCRKIRTRLKSRRRVLTLLTIIIIVLFFTYYGVLRKTKLLISYRERNAIYTTEFWESVRRQVHDDVLYQKSFDVGRVVTALREARVIEAHLFKFKHSLKFKLVLEGNQTAVFKVMNM